MSFQGFGNLFALGALANGKQRVTTFKIRNGGGSELRTLSQFLLIPCEQCACIYGWMTTTFAF